MESFLNWGMLLVLMLVLIWVYLKKADRSEKHIGWKIIGYYILGAFTFRFNGIVLPIGILVFFVFLLPKLTQNEQAKKWSAYIGVGAFLFGVILNFSMNAYYEKAIHVKPTSENAFKMKFYKDYKKIKSALHADGELSIQHYDLSFNKDGKIDNLFYNAYYSRNGKNMESRVELDRTGNYLISPAILRQEDSFLDESQYISNPDLYFIAMDQHGLQQLIPENDQFILSFSNQGDYVQKDESDSEVTSWEIKRTGIEKMKLEKDEQNIITFPYQISITGMKNQGAGSYTGDQYRYYTISPELYE